ncbi:hypothetical protein [Aquabacter spiritensis]|uniref:STAS domain-containing protein n=1 Tax=Aquabacter spiritensis TaxID=933073 RepID=A0A4R3LMV1_9HYPH|nr:hypothetical protein [Aquabacter spiritensis]TCT01723.1 hypothetical protein EDC64_11776 [Aquabacter spiritensis]
MPVRRLDPETLVLEGHCPVEDAEALLRLLSATPDACVDWRGCESAHAALVQILLATGARRRGPPAGPFLRSFVDPALDAASPNASLCRSGS